MSALGWLALLTAAPALRGQSAPAWTRVLWYTYNADHPVSDRWELHFDGSYRPTLGSPARQWMVRPGVNVRLADRLRLSFAYGYFDTHPHGLKADDGETREHRLHQQVEYSIPWRRNVIRHRFRMEERWLSSPHREGMRDSWRWQDRPRYMLRLDRPLPFGGNGTRPVFTAYGEVLFSFASPAASAFEQHREYTGITWRLAQRFSVETGVMHQAVKSTAGPFRHNVIIQLTLRNNAPLRDLFGWMKGK